MRHSHFWELMTEQFGTGYARSVASDQALADVDGLTADQALAAGHEPREVWLAVCTAMDVAPGERWGRTRRPDGHGAAPGRAVRR